MSIFAFVGIAIVISFIIRGGFIISKWGEWHGFYGKYGFGTLFMSFFLHLVAYLCITLVMLCVDFAFTPIDHWNTSTCKLYGLGNNTATNGRFVLGSGTIKDVQYIFYNTKDKDGYIQTHKAPMDDCYFDNESDSSYLEYKEGVRKPRFGLFGDIKCVETERMKARKYIFHLRKEDMDIDNHYDINKY